MSLQKKVSIGIPYTDQGEELAGAIKSVLAQTHTAWELILVGDGPSGDTAKIVQRFSDPRIRCYTNHQRLGLAATLNRIAGLAKYPFLARMDADDVMHPERIAVQLRAFDDDPKLDLVGSYAYLIDDANFIVGAFNEPPLPASGQGFLQSNAFSHPTVMGTTAWFRANPYDETLLRGQDKELWLRTWETSRFLKLPHKLMFYRVSRELSPSRLRRNEAYNRHILSMYSNYEGSVAAQRRRLFGSHAKEIVLSAARFPSVSRRLYDRKSTPLEPLERLAAEEALRRASAAQVPAPIPTSNVVALTVTYGQRHSLVVRTASAALAAGASKVLVIDNGSTPSSQHAFMNALGSDSRVEVIRNDVNEGSAAGFAKGVSAFTESDGDYLWMLDDDNECTENTLREQLASLARHRSKSENTPLGVLSVRSDNPRHLKVVAGKPVAEVYPGPGSFMYFDFFQYVASKLGRSRTSRNAPVDIEVPYGPYGGLLISRSTLEVIGLPDASFGLYEDDTEYTSRIAGQGGRLILCTTALTKDIDGKWTETAGESGLIGLVTSKNSLRTYFAVRNRVHFDKSRLQRKSELLRFRVNMLVYKAAVTACALSRQPNQLPTIKRAVRDGIAGDFTEKFQIVSSRAPE